MVQAVNTWDTADQLDGLDILDKAQLVDVRFRIVGVQFTDNKDGVSICYVDAEKEDGTEFTFLDSSTGVRAQLVNYLTSKGMDAAIDSGDYLELNLVAPNGLRVSEYQIPERGPNGQELRGKFRTAKTFYLTTSGKRQARTQTTPAKSRTKPTAS